MHLAMAVDATCNMGASGRARTEMLRAKGVVALLPSLAVRLAALNRTHASNDAMQGESSALRLLQDGLLGTCDACGTAAAPAARALKRCSGCRAVAYCSVECQRRGWAPPFDHRGVCAAAAAAGAAALRAASAEH
jgi:hypothetical protein